MSEEPFIKEKFDWIDNLKVRFSIGQLGSQNGLGYGISYLNMVNLSQKPIFLGGNTLYRYLSMGNIPNTNLKWQVTNNYNLGLDVMLWKGLLGLELDMFYSITRNKIESQTGVYPPSLGGYYSSLVNTGKHENKGFEIVLTHKNSWNDLTYDIRGNVSWARNKILSINENTNVPDYQRMVGKSMGLYLGFMSDGLFQSEEEIANSAVFGPTLPGDIKLVDINGDGKITLEQDRVPIGRSNIPELMYGLNLGASYKGFDLSIFLTFSYGNEVLNATKLVTSKVGSLNYNALDVMNSSNRWMTINTEGEKVTDPGELAVLNAGKTVAVYHDAQQGDNYIHSWAVEDASYLKLSNVTLGYTFPKNLIARVGLKNLRLYATGNNLLTWTKYSGFDPEVSTMKSGLTPGVDFGAYPLSRSFIFGLNVAF